MSHDIKTELWNLQQELDQLNCATHYFSDLKPTAEHYEEQWTYFGQQSDQLTKIFTRLCAHLETIGIEPTPPEIPDTDMSIDDEIPF